MSTIIDIFAREVLDSRGVPTVEVDVTLDGGFFGRAIVPSGASTGRWEAWELRDGDDKRYFKKGVLKAVKNVNDILAPQIIGMDALFQTEIDKKLCDIDATPVDEPPKKNLGANAILGVSLAVAKAAANYLGIPLYRYIGGISANTLPLPMMNFLNGGKHANFSFDIQEFMIVPRGAENFREGVRMGSEIFHKLGKILEEKKLSTSVGDEGGYAPKLHRNEDALALLAEATEKSGYKLEKDISFALDVAASELYKEKEKIYHFPSEGRDFTSQELVNYYEELIKKYPAIISIEDGLSEDDWNGWKILTETLGQKIQIVGDDLFVTNPFRLKEGIKNRCANAILVKLNQIGTLTETLEVIDIAKRNGYKCVISHRSGESEDTTISHLAVGVNAGQIKTGSLSRSERIVKYNELMRIEENLGDAAKFYKF